MPVQVTESAETRPLQAFDELSVLVIDDEQAASFFARQQREGFEIPRV